MGDGDWEGINRLILLYSCSQVNCEEVQQWAMEIWRSAGLNSPLHLLWNWGLLLKYPLYLLPLFLCLSLFSSGITLCNKTSVGQLLVGPTLQRTKSNGSFHSFRDSDNFFNTLSQSTLLFVFLLNNFRIAHTVGVSILKDLVPALQKHVTYPFLHCRQILYLLSP